MQVVHVGVRDLTRRELDPLLRQEEGAQEVVRH